MKKKLILLICITVMIFSIQTGAGAMGFRYNVLKDTNEHWAEKEMNILKDMGVMNGYEGFAYPDNKITRGEFTAMITRAYDIKVSGNAKVFSDVPKGHMFYDAITAAASSGIINGFEDNTFRPAENITREQIVLIISRLGSNNMRAKPNFKDIKSNYKYMSELTTVYSYGIIGGYPDGTFMPYNNTTRAEAASIIVKSMKVYIPSGNIDSIYEFAHEYIISYFTNTADARQKTTGVLQSDIDYIENTYNKAKQYGYNITNSISDIEFADYSQNGPFTEFKVNYTITKNINSKIKTYRESSTISLITRDDIHKVYSHNTNIKHDGFINLTWEIFSGAPSYAPKGVNIVSPTSFRVEAAAGNNAKKLSLDGITLYFNSTLTDDYLNYAKENNYDVWVMYKTDFTLETANMFLNSANARSQANDILIEQILKYDLDGINFDFEHMNKSDSGAYANHVKEISLMAHTLGAVVSVDVNKYEKTSSTWSMCFDRDELAKYADYIFLMAYDQFYTASKYPGPVAGLDWTQDCINISLKEIPKEKLVLGMPYYIRVWETKDGKNISSKALSMEDAIKTAKENNASEEFDTKYGLYKYSWDKDDKTYVFWMENAESIGKRVELAKNYQLAGIGSWRRGFESMDVWDKIAEIINS